MMRAAQIVRDVLEDEGVRFTFGIPGTHNIELYDALAEAKRVVPVLVTDEQGASFMADAVARVTGTVGVVNVVPGAGVTHALSGIAEAYMDNVPLLVLACGVRTDTDRAYQLHDVDQLAILRPVVKAAWRVDRPERLAPTLRRAFALAREGPPGPVAVEIAANLYLHGAAFPAAGPVTVAAPGPAPEAVTAAADLLARARRPALYLGWGARGATDRLVELAERLGAPVVTTIQGKGVFPESHPLWLWNGFGRSAPRFVRRIMDPCDALVAIGCRFGEVATASYGCEPPAALVHVDLDRAAVGRNFPAAVPVHADARLFVESLLPRIGERRTDLELRADIARGHAALARHRARDASAKRVTPARFFAALQRTFGPKTIYTTDSGNGTFLAMEHLRLDEPSAFLAPVDYSCMGYAVPAAVGAALARPDRPVVALAGDGAFLMTGLEIATAVSHRAAPVICVLRDGTLGQIAQFQELFLSRPSCSQVPEYDLGLLARAVGAEYVHADSDAGLAAALETASAARAQGRVVVVDVAIDYSRRTFFTWGAFATTFLRMPMPERLRLIARAGWRRLAR